MVHHYEPLAAHRQSCPWSLVVCRGAHPHPAPLPQKTPPYFRMELQRILESLDDDLADLTPRRLLRHPILKSFLSNYLPHVECPTLGDLHVSLSNRSHVKYYIDEAKKGLFPFGTGWEGVCQLKELHERELPLKEQYIRQLIEIVNDETIHEEDEAGDNGNGGRMLRLIICMTQDASHRMSQAQYMQSDIVFKRIVGFYEFEIGFFDRNSNTSVTLCRVFLNRQTAFAHQKVFESIDSVLKQDTGSAMRWRRIHGRSRDDFSEGMVLQWTGDQHGGQAKGLGLYLESISQQPEHRQKFDLHDPERLISSLNPYEHLHRLYRLCTVHVKRNIRKVSTSDEVRNLMRGLICLEHDNWDGALDDIVRLGGKAASDWVQDKIRSKFAFEAICWQKSCIPLPVWKAGDSTSNLIEAAHSDVNREGVHCTLLSGIKKGRAFDRMKLKSLQTTESLGIRPSYASGHISANATKNLKRKFDARHRALENEDEKIRRHNELLCRVHQKLEIAKQDVLANPALRSAQAKLDQARIRFKKQISIGQSLIHTGSGNVGLLLLADASNQ